MACMASFTEAGITTYGPGAIVDLGYAVHQATVMNVRYNQQKYEVREPH